jgi:putative transposase
MTDINSLEHTKYRCQYHIVFAPKYRRQIIYREIKADIGFILKNCVSKKG